eukprot:4308246-Pyramimonas_sp.AAC.1
MQPLQPEISAENRQQLASDSDNTNRFQILDRAADRVQSSRFKREGPLMILNQILYVSAL